MIVWYLLYEGGGFQVAYKQRPFTVVKNGDYCKSRVSWGIFFL